MTKLGRILTEDELAEAIEDCDVVLIEFDPLTKTVLDRAKKLKVIASVRGGAHANVDVDEATRRGIPIFNVPGRNQDTVADFTIGMVLALSRGIAKGNLLIKNRKITDDKTYVENGFCTTDVNWVGSTPEKFAYLQYKGPTLAGKTMGLVGFGAIGRETAKRALAFGMDVVAYDPFVKQSEISSEVKLIELSDLMPTADFVSIHLPVNKGTLGIVSAEMLRKMKKTAYLINTARAAVMDYDKLIEMLQKDEIAGAALDVYPVEPLPNNHVLLELDNVVLTPHIGGCSMDPYARSYDKLFTELKLFLDGGMPEKVYNPEFIKQ